MRILQKVLVVLLLLPAAVFADAPPTKQEQWDAMEYNFNHLADGMGTPIDMGIKDSVIVLNLLGFQTNGSCQGHIYGERAESPCIEFFFNTKLKDLIAREQELGKKLDASAYSSVFDEWQTVRAKIKSAEIELLASLEKLLADFYAQHRPDSKRKLIVDKGEFGSVLRINSTSEHDKNLSLEKQKENVIRNQEEMWRFTLFLKDRFFAGEKPKPLSAEEKWNRTLRHFETLEIIHPTYPPAMKDLAVALTLLGMSVTDGGYHGFMCEDRLACGDLYHLYDIALCDYCYIFTAFQRKPSPEQNASILQTWKRVVAACKKIEKTEKPHFIALKKLLGEFYQKYPTSGDQKIIFTDYGLLINRDLLHRKKLTFTDHYEQQKLNKQEMDHFAKFLKERYFASSKN